MRHCAAPNPDPRSRAGGRRGAGEGGLATQRRRGTAHAVTVLAAAAALLLLATCERAKVVQGFPDSFVGVGVELRIVGDIPVVVRTIPGGSAAEAGVKAGDRVTLIDDTPTEGLSLGAVVMRIRGKPDTQITLTIDRGGERVIVVVRRRAMAKADTEYEAAK